ncbi:MAG TPA: mannose-6-phosphate isomerase, class I [Polyangiaceae bacterium]|nr:mannose-6-phosphate isomerase, class I [Polyangiaceae bacterium]
MSAALRQGPVLLDNPIQNYAWGSRSALAQLLGRPAADRPEAELWIGAHPAAPSRDGNGHSLLELIQADPERTLGSEVAHRFGRRLPFLLKVLAVEAPLSLQAHPNLQQAQAGFAREQAAGIPLDARERTYKDDNHKPELLCALTPFEALSGFRPPLDSAALFAELGLAELPFVRALRSSAPEPLREAFSGLMSLAAGAAGQLAAEVLERAERASASKGRFQASFAWAARLGRAYPGDIGAVASLLLNHLQLAPLEAIDLEAGRLHAYLSGTGVEIMANSDNVLRGGLTPKHIDVPELLRVLVFDSPPVRPTPATRLSAAELAYQTSAAEFQLSRIDLEPARACSWQLRGPELLLCVDGRAQLEAAGCVQELARGQACFLPAAARAARASGSARLFRAAVGGA